MKKTTLLLLFIGLTSCKEIVKEVLKSSASSSNSKVEQLKPTDYNVVAVDDGFKLSLPDYMKKMTGLNDDASLQYAYVFKETYVIVIYEDKHEFVKAFKELGEYNDDTPLIDNYRSIQTGFFRESVDDLQVIPYNVNTIGELNARQTMMKGRIDGENIGYVMGFIEGDDNVFMIMTWTLQDRLNKYEQTFKDIIGSFELI